MKARIAVASALSVLYLVLSLTLLGIGLNPHGELLSLAWVFASFPALLAVYGLDGPVKISAAVVLLGLLQYALIGWFLGWLVDRRRMLAGNR